jgi:hypothetical protein
MSAASRLHRQATWAALGLLATTATVAAAVRLAGLAAAAREWLVFEFTPPAASAGAALAVAAGNLRLAAAVLLAALLVRQRPATRPVLDVVVAGLAALNACAAGVALAAYGVRLLEAVAAHGALELTGFAIAGGAYLAARRGALDPPRLAAAAAVSTGLLAAAAVVETYVPIGAEA